jgi:ribosomal protein S18 acetylase RimI-like enzyme
MITIRKATKPDLQQIWEIFQKVVQGGDTYVFAPNTSRDDCYYYWFDTKVNSYVAEKDSKIVGMYKIVENYRDLGSHVANASYMVDPDFHGHGIGKKMALHSLEEAKKMGFFAMQFNFVVSTNSTAIELWKKLGFEIVGILPKAFNHKTLGLVDAYVMHRFL